mmetsp:Transcript_24210/g.41153  ORF Transcript_24210/g.41153 Transcript_24210/m.41153 type:complete len:225 (-) Transcript_24210:646-1320(-)
MHKADSLSTTMAMSSTVCKFKYTADLHAMNSLTRLSKGRNLLSTSTMRPSINRVGTRSTNVKECPSVVVPILSELLLKDQRSWRSPSPIRLGMKNIRVVSDASLSSRVPAELSSSVSLVCSTPRSTRSPTFTNNSTKNPCKEDCFDLLEPFCSWFSTFFTNDVESHSKLSSSPLTSGQFQCTRQASVLFGSRPTLRLAQRISLDRLGRRKQQATDISHRGLNTT